MNFSIYNTKVPLNRLVLKSQNCLNEPVLEGLATDFEPQKIPFFIQHVQ